MIHTKTVVVPETTEVVSDFISCDLCGKKKGAWENDTWDDDCFGVRRTRVFMIEGSDEEFGSSAIKTKYDICTKCFKNKLIPWLAEQGAEPGKTTLSAGCHYDD